MTIGVTLGEIQSTSLEEISVSSVIIEVTSDGTRVLSLREASINSVMAGTTFKGLEVLDYNSTRVSPVIFSSESESSGSSARQIDSSKPASILLQAVYRKPL